MAAYLSLTMILKDLPSDSPPPFSSEDSECPAPEAGPSPECDNITREFHPHSRRPSQVQNMQDYLESESLNCFDKAPPEEQPWLPFQTRLDFEVSEFAHENNMNQTATEKFIQLLRRVAANIQDFTIRNHADMEKQWELASSKCTSVS